MSSLFFKSFLKRFIIMIMQILGLQNLSYELLMLYIDNVTKII